jgi:hypothetical protein
MESIGLPSPVITPILSSMTETPPDSTQVRHGAIVVRAGETTVFALPQPSSRLRLFPGTAARYKFWVPFLPRIVVGQSPGTPSDLMFVPSRSLAMAASVTMGFLDAAPPR